MTKKIWEFFSAFVMESNSQVHVNAAYDPNLDEPPNYEETRRAVRPSVVSAFGHDTLDRVPNIDFYRNAGSVSGHRAVRPSLQELHDVFQKVSDCIICPLVHLLQNITPDLPSMTQIQLPVSNQVKEIFIQVTPTSPLGGKRVIKAL